MTTTYTRVADDLRQAILSGQYRPGDALPSEPELMERYGLSRYMVRSAIKLLRSMGLVDTSSGKPTTVRKPQPRIRRDASRYQWEKDQVARGGLPHDSHLARDAGLPVDGTQLELVTDELVPAGDAPLALYGLAVDADAQVRHYCWLLGVQGVPSRIAHHWYAAELDEAVRAAQPGNALHPSRPVLWPGGTMYQLAQQGIEVGHVDDVLTCRMPLPEEIDLLRLPEGVPLLVVCKTTYDTGGVPREVVEVLMPGDRTEAAYRTKLRRWRGGPQWAGDSDGE